MQEELTLLGYKLSRTALYLRLIPRNSRSIEGKRHIAVVPVKLCRAQADYHKDHADQHFCRATVNALEEIALILGPEQVGFKFIIIVTKLIFLLLLYFSILDMLFKTINLKYFRNHRSKGPISNFYAFGI